MMRTVTTVGQQHLSKQEFQRIQQLVHKYCGINLAGKQALVEARLKRCLEEFGFTSFGGLCEHLEQNTASEIFSTAVDRLTTNHTSFFREPQHFVLLREVIVPEAMAAGGSFAVWSAACASGEEPYSIAFTLADLLDETALKRTSILATDISTRALQKARRATYPIQTAECLSPAVRTKCLLKGTGEFGDRCLVRKEIRSRIVFRQFNLLDNCSSFGPFDVIFCRNVMIYFDRSTQEAVAERLASRLKPGGYLLIGHSESLHQLSQDLQYVSPSTYRKKTSATVRKRLP